MIEYLTRMISFNLDKFSVVVSIFDCDKFDSIKDELFV
jgi:hypothetical protein